jgi:hypothetical protein
MHNVDLCNHSSGILHFTSSMATVSHTIYSRYDPQEREALERETGQLDEIDPNDAWQSDSYLGSQRQRALPPHFVPATRPISDWGFEPADSSIRHYAEGSSLGYNVSGWYRSLTSKKELDETKLSADNLSEGLTELTGSHQDSVRIGEKRNKNNWFIMKALQSEQVPFSSSQSPSLADIIARDSFPMPTEERYKPPVWLEIGPSNKGFEMLQRSGWSEGEALGPDIVRRPTDLPRDPMIKLVSGCSKKGKGRADPVKQEVLELKLDGHDDLSELREVDIIDLTLSDSDADKDDDNRSPTPSILKAEPSVTERPRHSEPALSSANGRTALLTPIATVLKSDRLGIGLKAKTVGPYKASQKRVTHNAAALAAHFRAAQESQRQKQILGRGRKGFAKQHKDKEFERKRLMAYLND